MAQQKKGSTVTLCRECHQKKLSRSECFYDNRSAHRNCSVLTQSSDEQATPNLTLQQALISCATHSPITVRPRFSDGRHGCWKQMQWREQIHHRGKGNVRIAILFPVSPRHGARVRVAASPLDRLTCLAFDSLTVQFQ